MKKKILDDLIKRELSNFLFEGRTEKISEIEAKRKLKTHIKEFGSLENAPQIFRGKSSAPDYGFIQPSNYIRKSAYTDNYYTLIIDNSDRWSDFPKRSKSIVCTTSSTRAGAYGEVLNVFPEIGSKIGVCPDKDVWISFSLLDEKLNIKRANEFNTFLNYLYDWAVWDLRDIKSLEQENFSRFKKQINDIGESKRFQNFYQKGKFGLKGNQLPSHIKNEIKEAAYLFYPNYTSFFEFIDDLLDPHKNGFEIKKYNKNLSLPDNKEVWMSSDSVLIKQSVLE